MSRSTAFVLSMVVTSCACDYAIAQQPSQGAPTVSQVLLYSTVSSPSVPVLNATTGLPTGQSFTMTNSVPNVFTGTFGALEPFINQGNQFFASTTPTQYNAALSIAAVSAALNQSVATALSIIPLASPASGLIYKTDPTTGADLPSSGTLGTIFSERAETIGKHHLYAGVSHQDSHFTSFNGQSLNALRTLYVGGDATNLTLGGAHLATAPVTLNLGFDVRLIQDLAFITYGVTDRFDVSVGLPMVHSAVAAHSYNAESYVGGGLANPNCWCTTTFYPGTPQLQLSDVGSSSKTATGFGDLLVRAKGTLIHRRSAVLAIGADVRFPTGDAQNFLGAGAASFKPFIAGSLYSKEFAHGIVFSPHADVGWQYIGKSILGGMPQPTQASVNTPAGPVDYYAAPFIQTKDYLPDVLSWAVGTEVAFGHHNTVVFDVLGNQIGLFHGIQNLKTGQGMGAAPCSTTATSACDPTIETVTGLVPTGKTSFGQYSGSFGYKVRVVGNLVFMFNALVRFDNNGLTARFVPLYGLGYTFP